MKLKYILILLLIVLIGSPCHAEWMKTGVYAIGGGDWNDSECTHLESKGFDFYIFNKWHYDNGTTGSGLFADIKARDSDAKIYVYYVPMNTFGIQTQFPALTRTSIARLYNEDSPPANTLYGSYYQNDRDDPNDFFIYAEDGATDYRVTHNYSPPRSCAPIDSVETWATGQDYPVCVGLNNPHACCEGTAGNYHCIVKKNEEVFVAKQAHTSSSNDEPLIGASWQSYWANQTYFWLDISNSNFRNYSVASVKSDFFDDSTKNILSWGADIDGIFSDHVYNAQVGAMVSNKDCSNTTLEPTYDTKPEWYDEMNEYLDQRIKGIIDDLGLS